MTLQSDNYFLAQPKIALIRMDRMGDLLCTLPVDQGNYPITFHWIISKNLGFIVDLAEQSRNFTEFELSGNINNINTLTSFLKNEKFDAAIVFHAPAWVSFAIWKAGIPLRFGPKSQWHQFIFLNQTLRQKRNKSILHEADYNFELFKWAINIFKINKEICAKKNTYSEIKNVTIIEDKSIHQTQNSIEFEFQFPSTTPFFRFKKLDLSNAPVSSLLQKPYIVIHPGMGGSALNWSQIKYIELIQIFLEQNYIVVITGTESDTRWLTEISNFCSDKKNVCWLVGELTGQDLITVLQNAQGVIAPSTGVIHLAAACQVPSIGLYSPLRVQSSTRWAPRSEVSNSITPKVNCPSPSKCQKEKCKFYPCLDLINPKDVFNKLINFF